MTDDPGIGRRDGIEIRRAEPEGDLPAILALASRSLGWEGSAADEAFFRWKHFENPFGVSPMWVATDAKRIVGFRTFLRWRFRARDGSLLEAVRAVDTATDPAYQGRGIFTKLTLGAVDELRDDGVDLIFNTPNDRSRPGYLKMGWSVVGRLPTAVRPTGIGSLTALAGAHRSAERWSLETAAGESAADVFEDHRAMAGLLAALARPGVLATERTPDFLAWRYGFGRLHYRIALAGSAPSDGLVVFRLRRRGRAVEMAVCDVLIPANAERVARSLLRGLARSTGADYLIRLQSARIGPSLFVRLPRLGPILTFRPLADVRVPTLSDWALTLGDIELL